MADEKTIISRLLDTLEMFSIENVMLNTMLITYAERFQLGNWQQDLEKAIEQFLKGTLPKGPVH